MDSPGEHDSLRALGQTVRHPLEHLECFPAPTHVTSVRLRSDEVVSVCPVTEQPDIASMVIDYEPHEWCIESKSLKLYLWSFRERRVFCEALAAEIAAEVVRSADPHAVTVRLTQQPRGGIVIEATASRSKPS